MRKSFGLVPGERCRRVRRARAGRARDPALAPEQLPPRHGRRHAVPGAEQRRRSGDQGHVRPRLFDRLPRRRPAGRPPLRAAQDRRRSGRSGLAGCAPPRSPAPAQPSRRALDELAGVEHGQCRLGDADVAYRVYALRQGQDASMSPRAWPAMTARWSSACARSSPTASSRARSRSRPPRSAIPPPSRESRRAALDLDEALDEGYRRNNSGNYAEAAEFFETLLQRAQDDPAEPPPLRRISDQPGAAALESRRLRRGRRPVPAGRSDPDRRPGAAAAAAQFQGAASDEPAPLRCGAAVLEQAARASPARPSPAAATSP